MYGRRVEGLPDGAILVGVDGGATRVRAFEARIRGGAVGAPLFELGVYGCVRSRPAGFQPLPLGVQVAGAPRSSEESDSGSAWVRTTAECIASLVRDAGAERVVFGLGLPGVKTPDGRGLAVVRNGPRVPDFLDSLLEQLAELEVEVVHPPASIESDGFLCGLGEELGRDGLFRAERNAYYVGGGTGIAEAWKLDGHLLRPDELPPNVARAWELTRDDGVGFEELVSAAGMNRAYAARRTSRSEPPPATDDESVAFPEDEALVGDPDAVQVLADSADALGELIYRRMSEVALHSGAPLERVVVGQRLARIYGDPRYEALYARLVERSLARRIAGSADRRLIELYWSEGVPHRAPPAASQLRAGAALGAAASAWLGLAARS